MKDGPDQPGDFEREDAALWDLMGKVSPPVVSSSFCRRVLREADRIEEERGYVMRWLRQLAVAGRLPHPVWSGALAAGLVCIASLSFAFHGAHLQHASPHLVSGQKAGRDDISARDVEVIADLDNLMADEENRIWTDENNTD